jgi:hypothetical protein
MTRRLGIVTSVVGVLALAMLASVASANSSLDQAEAKKELMAARVRAASCSKVSGVTGSGKLKVTINTSGLVSDILMLEVPPKMDDKTDACVRAEFSKIHVTPFEGDTVVVTGAFVLM